jgi:multidrug efflux pump subunit AcrA (membrane-fusion protein)
MSDVGGTPVGRRRGVRSLAGLVGVSLLSGGVGWVASRELQSPADVAARTAAPVASRIVAPVEFRVLRSTLFTRGTVRFGSPRVVTLPVSAVKTGSSVVIAPPVKGASLSEGSKVADIGGRPVVVLEGETPMYRDIRPGDSGADVASLKVALGRLGFAAGDGDVFDGVAEEAVGRWLRSVGYEPFGPTDAQADRLKAAADAVRKAGEQVAAAQLSVSKGQVVVTRDKVLAADEAVRTAVDRVEAVRADSAKAASAAELAIVQKTAQIDSLTAAVSTAELGLQRAQTDVSGVLSIAEAQQAVKNAQQAVVAADAAVVKANKLVDAARVDAEVAASDIPNAEAGVVDAKNALALAIAELERQRAKPAPTIPVAPSTVFVDQESKDQVVRGAEAAVAAASAGVRSAEAALRGAQRAAQRAAAAVDDAIAAVEPLVVAAQTARDQVPLAELRLKQAENGGASGSVSVAGAGSPGGSGSSGGSVVAAQLQLDQARAAVVLAERELQELFVSSEAAVKASAAALRSADAQVVIARAQRVELSKPQDVSALRATLVAAQAARADAQAELSRLQASTGVIVPANEVLFLPRLPLRVDDTKLLAGDALSGALMTVASQRLAIDASVDPADATGLTVGQKAEIEVADLNLVVPVTINRVASQTGTNGVDASRIYVELVPVDVEVGADPVAPQEGDGAVADTSVPSVAGVNRQPKLSELNGISVKVTIPISTTAGDVLVVPTAAVSAAVDGTTRVEVETSQNQPTRFVTVNAGLRSEGFVQVTPIRADELKEGDLVVTGNRDGRLLEGVPEANDRSAPGGADVSDSTPTTVA